MRKKGSDFKWSSSTKSTPSTFDGEGELLLGHHALVHAGDHPADVHAVVLLAQPAEPEQDRRSANYVCGKKVPKNPCRRSLPWRSPPARRRAPLPTRWSPASPASPRSRTLSADRRPRRRNRGSGESSIGGRFASRLKEEEFRIELSD